MLTSYGPLIPPNMKSNDAGPLTRQQIKERIMMFSGLTSEQLGLMMGAGAEKLYDQLKATKVQYFAHEGTVVDERTTPDHAIQQKAAVELIGLAERVGGLKANESETGSRTGNITFDMSGWSLKPADSKLEKPVRIDDVVIPIEVSSE